MTDGPAPAGPSVTGRVIDVLEAFTATRRTMTLSELSRHSGLPLTTTHRLAGELIRRGMLARDAGGRLHIGLRLWEIGALSPSSVGLRESALPFLEDLYEVTHENVQLAVLDGVEAVYLERISGRRSVHALTRVGGRLPVHATGVGLVLLAHAGRDVQQQVLAGPLTAYTPFTVVDPLQIRAILADVRRKG
jgi:DNA-binding IclR family transcriptional regulator